MLDAKLIPAADGSSKRLLIVLHGLGDSMEGYAWVPQVLKYRWLNYLLVNAPDEYYGGFSWYDYAGNPEPGVRRSIALLHSLLDDCRAKGFPTEQTVLAGFSQGCLMTLEAGLRYPHRFAGLVGMSGYVLSAANLLSTLSPTAREQRILMTHGRQDPVIPFARVRDQKEQLRAGGLQIEWHEFDMAHTIVEEELAVIARFIETNLGE
jgi:phospholipase/carboxylesterase